MLRKKLNGRLGLGLDLTKNLPRIKNFAYVQQHCLTVAGVDGDVTNRK